MGTRGAYLVTTTCRHTTTQADRQRRQGSITMDRHLKELVDSDEITQETAQRYAHTSAFENL